MNNKFNDRLITRLTTEEKAQLKKDAHRHEMTMSEYVRWLIAKERGEDVYP